MNSLEKWLLQNKDKIEKAVEIMGQGCEVLAVKVGQLCPILEAVFMASAELLNNPEGKEAKYLAAQFEKVNQKLESVQDEVDRITLAMQRTSLNKQNFDREAQMISQYEKFQDFVIAKPGFKDKKKDKFLSHFENTAGDLNLDALYNAVTGENISGDPMLKTVVATEQRSRRAVEEFCARLKKLFIVGIIAVVGHAALKDGNIGEDMVKKWQGRMKDVEIRMKAAVDDCTENFAIQAKEDIEHLLKKKQGSIEPNFTQSLLDFLAKKYDWVSWSLRVFNHSGFFFSNWLAGKKYHGRDGGGKFFVLLEKNNIRVAISFSVEPKPINKSQVQELIEGKKYERNMESVAKTLNNDLPNCVVHAVSLYKDVVESNNFPEECYYFGKHKIAHLCVHSE
ncbi:uncharacterized protein LOC133109535 [Conger conger]|uniref:uncharacterized protein LOC133109535 n=1 Tax=Conger conger TaxID=82655 RepID=UPI002A5AB6D4|nr:uncharacterized protein LOC133109535 [Conger conger]